jgi:flagellar biosynthesis/type III secretory pathway M-ring protein FliF/YscJ
VQALRDQLALVQTRIASLDTTAKLLVGSLVIVLAMALFLVAQYAGATDMTPLAINASAQADATRFLRERGIQFREEAGRILVPSESHSTIISALGESNVGGGDAIDFNALVALDTPFDTARQSDQRKLIALQNVLARTIAGFKGVKSATVVVSARPAPGMQGAAVQSASVSVQMKSGEALTQAQVDAIASLVAGSQAGLKPENVAITDGEGPRKPRAGRDRMAAENLEQQQKIADSVEERIHGLLSNIPGVLISVNPQVVTKTVQETQTSFSEAVTAPASESRVETSSRSAPPAAAPGVRSNTGMDLADARGGTSTTSEKQQSEFVTRIPQTQRSEFDPTGYAVKIDVGIALPWSYFRRVHEHRTGGPKSAEEGAEGAAAAAPPDEAALAKIRDEEVERIRKLVETQIQTDAIEGSKRGTVEVTWFYDFDGGPVQAGVGGGAAAVIDAIAPSGGAGGLVKTIALGSLAVLSLGMMLMMVRKAAEKPDLPSASELAGVPPTLEVDEADLVGEADESAPALEGMELDDDSLRREQMLQQLNELVKRDSVEAASLLRRWMRTSEK